MSERHRPVTRNDAPAAPRPADLGVAGTVSGPSGTPLLTVAVRTEPTADQGGPDLLVVAAAGEVDLDTAALLEAALVDAVVRRSRVCCDLTDVTFLSASGVSALLVAHVRAIGTGCQLTLRGAHGSVRRVLSITGLESLLGGR
jgi:anti-anti-sigma factor